MKAMKKTIAMAVSAMLLSSVAAAEPQMTAEELKAIWQDSFTRMNTIGQINPVAMDDFDLAAFEAEYTANTGYARKDDLCIVTLPEEKDVSYADAYRIAVSSLTEAFGTTEEELAAMGIYPVFIRTVYNDELREWDFTFTPVMNVDIDEDRYRYNEYRVVIASPGGEVTEIFQYMEVPEEMELYPAEENDGYRGINPHTFIGTDKGTGNPYFSLAPEGVMSADDAWMLALQKLNELYDVSEEAALAYSVTFGYNAHSEFHNGSCWQFDFENRTDPLDSYEVILSALEGELLYICGPGEGNG